MEVCLFSGDSCDDPWGTARIGLTDEDGLVTICSTLSEQSMIEVTSPDWTEVMVFTAGLMHDMPEEFRALMESPANYDVLLSVRPAAPLRGRFSSRAAASMEMTLTALIDGRDSRNYSYEAGGDGAFVIPRFPVGEQEVCLCFHRATVSLSDCRYRWSGPLAVSLVTGGEVGVVEVVAHFDPSDCELLVE